VKRILIIHGPTIGLCTERKGGVGTVDSIETLNKQLTAFAVQNGMECTFFHSNHEGDLVDALQRTRGETDGVILNAGGYAHYSYVIRDAAALLTVPCVEVHPSNIYAMGERTSIVAPVCAGQVTGFGKYSYFLAVLALKELLSEG